MVQAATTVIDARVAAPSLQLVALRQQEDGKVSARFEAGDATAAQAAREALLAAGWATPTGGAAESGTGFPLEWSAKP
jgi:hypothetical protein